MDVTRGAVREYVPAGQKVTVETMKAPSFAQPTTIIATPAARRFWNPLTRYLHRVRLIVALRASFRMNAATKEAYPLLARR